MIRYQYPQATPASAPNSLSYYRGSPQNSGPTWVQVLANLGPKPSTTTQNKARRAIQITFLRRPWAQEVSGSDPGAPTTNTWVRPGDKGYTPTFERISMPQC